MKCDDKLSTAFFLLQRLTLTEPSLPFFSSEHIYAPLALLCVFCHEREWERVDHNGHQWTTMDNNVHESFIYV